MGKTSTISLTACYRGYGTIIRIAEDMAKHGWHFALPGGEARFSTFSDDPDREDYFQQHALPFDQIHQLESKLNDFENRGFSYLLSMFWLTPECEVWLSLAENLHDHLLDITLNLDQVPSTWSSRLTNHNWWLERIIPSVERVCGEVSSLIFEERWG